MPFNENNLSVCLLNDSFPPLIDGVANTVVNYAENLKKLNYGVSVVVPAYPNTDDSGFDFPVYRYQSIDTRKLVGYTAGFPFSAGIQKKLILNHVNIVHSHCPVASTMLARELRKGLDAPLILTYHSKFDIDIEKLIKGKALRDGAVKVLVNNVSACDEVWVVSRGAGENLRSIGFEGQYTVMRNGVDMPKGRVPTVAEKLSARYGLEDKTVLLFVGRMMWYKGIKIILDAMAKLRGRCPDYRAVFVGGGQDEDEIRAYAKECGLDKVCLFTGPVYDRRELRGWYTRSTALLFPSSYDTNGLVVREAAASSVPSVLLRGSCAAEDVIDGETGYLIGEDADSMATAISTILNDPEGAARIGENAKKDLYVSWEDSVKNAVERYGTVIENYKSGLYKTGAKQRRPGTLFFDFAGELMEFFAETSIKGDAIKNIVTDRTKRIKTDISERAEWIVSKRPKKHRNKNKQ